MLRAAQSRRAAASSTRPRSRDELGEVLFEHVVAEVHHEVVVAEEPTGDQHAVGEPERLLLGDVGDVDAPKRLPSPTASMISAAGCRPRSCRCRRSPRHHVSMP
jgi:hypothetical protein